MPMIPRQGASSPAGFGPSAGAQLGAGALPPGMGGMAADPTDPSAAAGMTAQPEITPPSIAEAIQMALEQRQAALRERQAMEADELIQADLMEADDFVQQLMGIMGQEATTLDGGGAIPDPMAPAAEGAPQTGMSGGGMAEAMAGAGGLGAPPAAGGAPAMPGLPPGMTPEMLEQILAGAV